MYLFIKIIMDKYVIFDAQSSYTQLYFNIYSFNDFVLLKPSVNNWRIAITQIK
jgi:hypothetical protein